MSPNSKEYSSLQQDVSSYREDPLSQPEEGSYYPEPYRGVSLSRKCVTAFLVAFAMMIASNVLLALQFIRPSPNSSLQSGTEYAGLTRDIAMPWSWHGAYNDENYTIQNELCEAINIDSGIVALSDSYVASKKLPEAQRFPWDEKKGLYLLNGYHNLHCLQKSHRSVMQFAQGEEQTESFEHVTHCLDSLRQDVLCDADDTPRFTTLGKDKASGVGQNRQCKDWSRLEAWAEERTACWRYINGTDENFQDEIQMFKYCPEGSPYTAKVKEFFGDDL